MSYEPSDKQKTVQALAAILHALELLAKGGKLEQITLQSISDKINELEGI